MTSGTGLRPDKVNGTMKWWWTRWKENREKVKSATAIPISCRGYDSLAQKYPFFWPTYSSGRRIRVPENCNACNIYPSEESALYEIREALIDDALPDPICILDQVIEPDQEILMRKGAYYSRDESIIVSLGRERRVKRVVSDRRAGYGRIRVLQLLIYMQSNTTLPSSLVRLTDLQCLVITPCFVGRVSPPCVLEIPSEIANMPKLSELEISFTVSGFHVNLSLLPQVPNRKTTFPNIKKVRILLFYSTTVSDGGEKDLTDLIVKQCPNIEDIMIYFFPTRSVDRLLKNMQAPSIEAVITPSPLPLSGLKKLSLKSCGLTENHLATLLCNIIPDQNARCKLEHLDVTNNNIRTLVNVVQKEPFKTMFSLLPKFPSGFSMMGVKRSFSLKFLKMVNNPVSETLLSDDRKGDDESSAAQIIVWKLGIEKFWFTEEYKLTMADRFNEASRICYKLKTLQEKEPDSANVGCKPIPKPTTTQRLGTAGWEYLLEKYGKSFQDEDEEYTILYSILRSHIGDIFPNTIPPTKSREKTPSLTKMMKKAPNSNNVSHAFLLRGRNGRRKRR